MLAHNTCGKVTAKKAKTSKPSSISGSRTTSSSAKIRNSAQGTQSSDPEFEKWLNKGEADNTVYYGMVDGSAKYTGITKQDLEVRRLQHKNNKKYPRDFEKLREVHSNLTRNQARALEQYHIEEGINEFNRINSISSKNRFYNQSQIWAKNYIDSH